MNIGVSATALLLVAVYLVPLPVAAKLSAVVTPSNASADGSDWCQPLKPCNETKTDSAEIESSYGLGLLSKSTSSSSGYQYSDVTPATAIDWRTVLTNWTVRDQGTCGKLRSELRLVCGLYQATAIYTSFIVLVLPHHGCSRYGLHNCANNCLLLLQAAVMPLQHQVPWRHSLPSTGTQMSQVSCLKPS